MDHNLLVSELQSLIVESKRRNPEVKDAGERALEILRSGPQPRDVLAERADVLLAPITLGCKTKNAKIVGISIAALQRLVALGGVSVTSLPDVLQTLASVAGQAVEIQLKILQTLLSILTYCTDIHGDILGNALLLCFRLQDSRVSVVSSTAAATLRQAVMLVFDRVGLDAELTQTLSIPTEPVTELTITSAAMDAYCIFSDLCLLTASPITGSGISLWTSSEKEKPRLLKLPSLQRTFGLELIESILNGYEAVVKNHIELLYLLQHSLDPLLSRLQNEKPSFPVALRVCRLIFVLIRSYADQIPTEVETYLVSLIRMGAGDLDEDKKEPVAQWLRVLSLEILRGLCGDPVLLRSIWTQYYRPDGPNVFLKLVSALGRLVNEKPALLGVGSQMHGLGVTANTEGHATSGYFDMGIGMVASAASAGVSTMSAMMGTGGGLGSHSAMKQRLIEQHDKSEAPAVPDTYIYLLAVQSLDAIAESIFSGVHQIDAREAVRGMAESAWPALLAALSFCIATDLSDALFADVLAALHDFTVACGELNLSTPRDAFLNTLARYAVPPTLVSAMQTYLENPTAQRNNSVINADTLGLTALGVGGPSGPPSLSDRNLACLRSLIAVAQTLAGSLGLAWHDVLEALQNANYLLSTSARKPTTVRRSTGVPTSIQQTSSGRSSGELSGPRPDILQDLDTETIQTAINALFDRSRELEDGAFTTFITALCCLSAEMIGMDTVVVDLTEGNTPTTPLFPLPGTAGLADTGRRRTSGINISQSIKSGERSFGLSKLRTVTVLNLPRLVAREPAVGWGAVTQHLLAVARHITAPSTIRLQASETLAELLLSSLRTAPEARVQHQVFDVLVRQVDMYPISSTIATDYDVRSSGYQTLNQILESSGHSLEVGWPTIFGMLNRVCRPPVDTGVDLQSSSANRTSVAFHRGDANLVRIAFPSLTLICTDFLSSLDAVAMRQCIGCLGCFGRQQDDVNITLAAIGLLWTLSDAVQGDSKELWLYLLTELLELGRDPRLDVRSSAMQTLFRCVELYGADLSSVLWEDVFWKVIFPLLETMRGDESQVLALTSVGSIFGSFLPQISALPSFTTIYQHLLDRLKRSFISEPRQCCTAALKALERILAASEPLAEHLDPTWDTFNRLSEAMSTGEPYTQENLVAFVRVASLLHTRLEWTDERVRQFSSILRAVIAYSRSPEYRPDVDVMSPLQQAVAELIAGSTRLGYSLVLSDLAEFTSLAYVGDGGSKLSYVALSKFAMPKMAEVFQRASAEDSLFEDGTVENVIGAYALPIKLKYDCPAPSKYGSDPPLWRTAMTTFVTVLDLVMEALDVRTIEPDRFEGIWGQVTDVFAGILLADDAGVPDDDEMFVLPVLERFKSAMTHRLSDPRVPNRIVEGYAETLRKASVLYHYDVHAPGGTTAPVVSESQEATRYWAFNLLVSSSNPQTGARRVGTLCVPALLKRFHAALFQFLEDAKLRGHMPFSRVREEELLYTLRHLVTMTLWKGSIPPPQGGSTRATLTTAYETSPRAHLFHFYSLLLALTFVPARLPSMWILPTENAQIFGLPSADNENETSSSSAAVNAGDGTDLIEVNARDLARRCLELVGAELDLS